MEKCPHCNSTLSFRTENKRLGTSGYPTKVISCTSCYAVLGTTISDEMQGMIEIIYNKIRKM